VVEKKMPPVYPDEILKEEFLVPLSLSEYRLAKDIEVPALRISRIVRGRRAVTANPALRLARYLGTSAEWWVDMQVHYDLEPARDEIGTGTVLSRRERLKAPNFTGQTR
jgi:antitoxin HigA-1